jgi:hypothetical protein
VVKKASSGESEQVRVEAVRVLSASSDNPRALDALVNLVPPRRKLFRWAMPVKRPETVAAVMALRKHAADKRVKRVLALAVKSKDPDYMRAARVVGGAAAMEAVEGLEPTDSGPVEQHEAEASQPAEAKEGT